MPDLRKIYRCIYLLLKRIDGMYDCIVKDRMGLCEDTKEVLFLCVIHVKKLT
jgi:hypothetical protein